MRRSLSICNLVFHACVRLSAQRGVCLSVSRPECVLQPPLLLPRTRCPSSTVSLKGKMCGGGDEESEHGQRKTNGKIPWNEGGK